MLGSARTRAAAATPPGGGFESVATRRFEVRRRLGAGGMGVVYEAWDRVRRGVVALKTLRALEPHALLLFKQEFRALADVQHPNLVRLGELFCDGDRWFFTMEYVEGVGLLRWVRPDAPLSPEERAAADDAGELYVDDISPTAVMAAGTALVAKLAAEEPLFDEARLRAAMVQLARGVHALHQSGLVHCDVKPSNVLVARDGRVVLLDFGLVADVTPRAHTQTELQVVGTVDYMAPEQAAARAVGPEADWYAVGAVLFEALTGRPPFVGAPIEVLVDKQRVDAPAPDELVRGLPADLSALCRALLSREPARRPTGDEVLGRLSARKLPSVMVAMPPAATAEARAPFVGRARELERLWAVQARVDEGGAAVALVEGESGVGKSTLARRFLDGLAAARADLVVLEGRCYERESVPFKAFDRVVDQLSRLLLRLPREEAAALRPRDAAMLARLFPVLRRVDGFGAPPPARALALSDEDAFAPTRAGADLGLRATRDRAFAALRELLHRLALRRPLVIFIDDLQWADADSEQLLQALLGGDEPPPLFVLATARDGGGLRAALAELPLVRVPVGRLSPSESAELVARLVDDEAARALALGDADGHPLFLQELTRHARGAHATATVTSLDEALWARAAALDPDARALLAVLALHSGPIREAVAARAAGLDAATGARAIALLRAAHLLRTATHRDDEIEPYHDRVREAVRARLGDDERRAVHARVAAVLDEEPEVGPDRLLVHLEAAGLHARAAVEAVRAGRRAAEKLAFDRAAALFARALELGLVDERDVRAVQLQRGEALTAAGRGREAAAAFLAAAATIDPATRFRCRRLAAEQLLGAGFVAEGRAILDEVLAEIDASLPSTPRRALARLVFERARVRLRGLPTRYRDEAEIAPAVLARIDVFQSIAISLGMIDTVRSAACQAIALRLALAAGEPRRIARGLHFEAVFLAFQGGRALDRATLLLDEAERIGERLGDPALRAMTIGARGVIALHRGHFPEAAALLATAEEELIEQGGGALELANGRIFHLLALRYLGDARTLSERFRAHVDDARRRGDRFTDATMVRAFGMSWLLAGRPELLEGALDAAAWTPPDGEYHIQHWYEWLARAELALYRGDVAEARFAPGFAALERSLLTRNQMLRAAAIWTRGRLALAEAATTENRKRRARLQAIARRACDRLRRERTSYVDVFVSLLEGALAAQEGDAARARARFDEAARAAREQGRRLYVLVAERRAAEQADDLLTKEGLDRLAALDAALRDEGVADPDRFLHVVAPGVPR